MKEYDWVYEVMKMFSRDYSDTYTSFFWRIDETSKELKLFAVVDGHFYFATEDVEPIETWDDVRSLEDCYDALRASVDEGDVAWAHDEYLAPLYAARRRKVVPEYLMDKMPSADLRKLFEEVE